jgi:hypothetical protein
MQMQILPLPLRKAQGQHQDGSAFGSSENPETDDKHAVSATLRGSPRLYRTTRPVKDTGPEGE